MGRAASGRVSRWRFWVPYLILGLWAATVVVACGWMVAHPPARAKRTVTACEGFQCIEKAQVRGGVDRAYRSQFAGRSVDCAARTWPEGPVVVCRWSS